LRIADLLVIGDWGFVGQLRINFDLIPAVAVVLFNPGDQQLIRNDHAFCS
jgi:hypothetical protein